MVKTVRHTTPASFESAIAELETIVREMDSGQLSLDDSLAAYERGTVLLKYCQEALGAAERKLQILEKGALRDLPEDATAAPARN